MWEQCWSSLVWVWLVLRKGQRAAINGVSLNTIFPLDQRWLVFLEHNFIMKVCKLNEDKAVCQLWTKQLSFSSIRNTQCLLSFNQFSPKETLCRGKPRLNLGDVGEYLYLWKLLCVLGSSGVLAKAEVWIPAHTVLLCNSHNMYTSH